MIERKQIEADLSADLVEYFKEQGMTLRAIADMIGLSESFISRVARKERCFTIEHLLDFEKATGQPLPLLLLKAISKESVSEELTDLYKATRDVLSSAQELRPLFDKQKRTCGGGSEQLVFMATKARESMAKNNKQEIQVIEMLRELSADVGWPPLQDETVNEGRIDICWVLQLTFQQLRHSKDREEVSCILKNMRKLSFDEALKQFHPECPGLPTMLNIICDCCRDLYDAQLPIARGNTDKIKEASKNAMHVCRNLLLPFSKRDLYEELHADARVAVANAISTLGRALSVCSQYWIEDFPDQLEQTVDLVVSALRVNDLFEKEPKAALQSFANEILAGLMILAKGHPEEWLLALRSLCDRRGPRYRYGLLCRLWRRLAVGSCVEAFAFLCKFINGTLECVWSEVESKETKAKEEMKLAEDIVGCIHDLVRQCCYSWGNKLGPYWHNQIHPVILTYATKRQKNMEIEKDPVQEYLGNMLYTIEKLPRVKRNAEQPHKVRIAVPQVKDPNDSLCGVSIGI